jgi:hypothetical protein
MQGQRYRQRIREEAWRQAEAQYAGSTAWKMNPEDRTADLVSVNLSFSTINTLLPFVADEDPAFIIEPYSGDATAENAALLESFMNRLWRSNDVQGTPQVRDGIFDYLLYGDGYVNVGYEIAEKVIFTGDGDKVENDVEIASFFVERINPWDLWVDPYSDGLSNARWVARRIVMPRAQLIDDDRFTYTENDAPGDVDDNSMSTGDSLRLRESNASEWVTLYEFYDLRERWAMTFLPGGTQIVRYVEHVVCPIVQIPNYRIPNSPYHMGELEQIASLQEELNKTRSQMITHRRRNVSKWLVRSHLLGEGAEDAMRSSKMNDVIDVESNEPFANIVQQLVPTAISSDAYAVDAQIRNDINDVTGVNEYLRGVIIEGATNIRTRHKLLQVENAARQIGQNLLNIIQDVLPLTDFEEMTQFVTGREAEKLNRATGADELQTDALLAPLPEMFEGRYEVRVERGSTELRNPEVKANQLKDMTQMMLSATPILMQLGIPFNIQRLMEMWFEAEGIDDVDALFETDEEQALRQQLDLQRQQQEAAGITGAAPSRVVGGTETGPGEPRSETTGAPSATVDETNSGLLGPRTG